MPDFPVLALLPVESLLFHERQGHPNTHTLIHKIQGDGILRNPSVVSPIFDDLTRYIILDRANQVAALIEMGFPHALVQILEPEEPDLILQNWNHIVCELNAREFLVGMRHIPGLRLRPQADQSVQPSLHGDGKLAFVQSCRGHLYDVCANTEDLETRVDFLNAIVDSYKDQARLELTITPDLRLVSQVNPSLSGLVVFPNFTIRELFHLASRGYLLPTGIAQFTVSLRAMHLDYPLEELAADKPLIEKNLLLQKWIQERIDHKRVRYYAESTYLFDE